MITAAGVSLWTQFVPCLDENLIYTGRLAPRDPSVSLQSEADLAAESGRGVNPSFFLCDG